jgi:hypothetical protein
MIKMRISAIVEHNLYKTLTESGERANIGSVSSEKLNIQPFEADRKPDSKESLR